MQQLTNALEEKMELEDLKRKMETWAWHRCPLILRDGDKNTSFFHRRMAEALAAHQAIEIARDRRWQHLIFEGDAKLILDAMPKATRNLHV